MTTPTRFRGSVRTINETSFAVAYGDATALVLDAVSLIGTERKARLQHAEGRLSDALAYADLDEEKVLANQLVNTIKYYKQRGLNV